MKCIQCYGIMRLHTDPFFPLPLCVCVMQMKKGLIFHINLIVREALHRISYKHIYARNTISPWHKKKNDIHFTIIWWSLLLAHWKRNTLMMLEIQRQCWSTREPNAITCTKFVFRWKFIWRSFTQRIPSFLCHNFYLFAFISSVLIAATLKRTAIFPHVCIFTGAYGFTLHSLIVCF